MKVSFLSSSKTKRYRINEILSGFNVDIESLDIDLPEFQSDDLEYIAREKAREAYKQINSPVFVQDSSWVIPSLGGFPGPFVRYINKYLTSEDYLNLLGNKDPLIILQYTFGCAKGLNNSEITTFKMNFNAHIMPNSIEFNDDSPLDNITYFEQVGKYMSELSQEEKIQLFSQHKVWSHLANWILNINNNL